MSYRNHTILFTLLAYTALIPAGNARCDTQADLINIQQKFAASIKPQFEAYYRELSDLAQSPAVQSDGPGLMKVNGEIKKVEDQLKGITTLISYNPTPVPAPAPAATTEFPVKPAPAKNPVPAVIHKTQTHINSTKGIAGTPKFSKNNVYPFTLSSAGKASSLTFYATGRRSTDTQGMVWLVTPNGEREKVTKWKAKDFDHSAQEVSSYEKLEPITTDISDLVNGPGLYKVEFEWTGGIDPLVIFRVELTS